MKTFRYNYNREGYEIYPRPKHSTISVLAFKKDKLSEQDDYLGQSKEEHSLAWLKEKNRNFETEWTSIIEKLNVQFNNRGKNIAMECLQFGGNTEFWNNFMGEREIYNYFYLCYKYAIHYIGYLSTDKNIICAAIIIEGRRRNLFVYYLPITEKWNTKVVSKQKSKNGNRLQFRDINNNPIYKTIVNSDCPLLCHSEFWKQRGGLTSYSNLQEDYCEAISKHYGAERGISTSRLKYTNQEQIKRFKRYEDDDCDSIQLRKIYLDLG